jgi:hypothetical protein
VHDFAELLLQPLMNIAPRIESPPRSKKLSRTPTWSTPSISHHIGGQHPLQFISRRNVILPQRGPCLMGLGQRATVNLAVRREWYRRQRDEG